MDNSVVGELSLIVVRPQQRDSLACLVRWIEVCSELAGQLTG